MALVAVLLASVARAVTVEVGCDRLSEEEQEELRARARLTLGTRLSPSASGVIQFRCDVRQAWWHSSVAGLPSMRVDARPDLVEAALEALEQRIQTTPNETVEDPSSDEPTPAAEPNLRLRESIPEDRARPSPQPGGLGVSVTAETRSGTLAVGPGFELGVGSGDWVGAVSESVRWESRESTLLWDARLGLGWGAPFAPERRLGLVASVGLQGLSVVGRDPGAKGDANGLAPIAGLGLRGSLRWGRTAAWVGLDGGYRLQPLEVGAPFQLSLPRAFVTLTVGVLMLADGTEREAAPVETSRRQ